MWYTIRRWMGTPRPPTEQLPSTPEGIRQATLEGIDSALTNWRAKLVMSDDQRVLLRAQRRYWNDAGGEQLTRLLDYVRQES
jgi:hypothetical protein